MGLHSFEVKIFFKEKVTKTDLKPLIVIKNHSKAAK